MPRTARSTVDTDGADAPIPGCQPLQAIRGLRLVMIELARGLADGRLDVVLETEPRLANAVAAVHASAGAVAKSQLTAEAADALRSELESVRSVMGRCALLGRTLDDLVRARCSSGYGASGAAVAVPVCGSLQEQA